MTWLVAHDVWPALTAVDPPTMTSVEWLERDGLKTQYTIMDDAHLRLGTIWTTYLVDEAAVRREDIIAIDDFPLNISPLRMMIDSTFTAEGDLDEFSLELNSPAGEVILHGERFHADFSFSLRSGRVERLFKVPLTDGKLISGSFHSFGQLGELRVGQRWRMQVFNPVAALTGLGERFTSVVVEVTGEERIELPEGKVNCLTVEAPGARAWVDAQGNVRLQEVNVPLVGKLRIRRESTFDEDARWEIARTRRGAQRPGSRS